MAGSKASSSAAISACRRLSTSASACNAALNCGVTFIRDFGNHNFSLSFWINRGVIAFLHRRDLQVSQFLKFGLFGDVFAHSHIEKPFILMVPTEGVEPTHPHGYQILSLARLPIPPRRHMSIEYIFWPPK